MHRRSEDRIFELFADDWEEIEGGMPVGIQFKKLYLQAWLHLKESKYHSEGQRVKGALEFRISDSEGKQGYVIRDLAAFVADMQRDEEIVFGKRLAFYPKEVVFAEGISQKLWQLLLSAKADEDSLNPMASYTRSYLNNYNYRFSVSRIFDEKYLKLSITAFDKFMDIVGDEALNIGYQRADEYIGTHPILAHYATGKLPIKIAVESKRKFSYIKLIGQLPFVFGNHDEFAIFFNEIYKITPTEGKLLLRLCQLFGKDRLELKMDNGRMWEFVTKILPQLEQVAEVQLDGEIEEKYLRLPLETEVFLDYFYDGLAARIVFHYGGMSFNPLLSDGPRDTASDKILVQDVSGENKIKVFLANYGFIPSKSAEMAGWFIQPDEELSYQFLQDLPELSKLADISCVDLKKFTAPANAVISVGVRINDKSILELSTKGKAYNFAELMGIFNSYSNQKKYYRLKDGRFMPLGNQQLDMLAGLLELVNPKKIKDDTVELPLAKALYVDALGRGENALKLERDKRFKAITKAVAHPEMSDVDIPVSLQDILREYQVTGVNWLNSLAKFNLGGILADDMGLGKTLQVIAFVLAKKQEALIGLEPALVVAPTSLVYNWLDEINKFAPELRAAAVAGNRQDRENLLQDISQYDIIITTYNLLARDEDLYSEKYFSYCFLDEAQHIKNPTTQKARTVKKLQAGSYFALTGTPIENTLTELWSIFDFIMPGYLYGHEKFKQRFEAPVVRYNDEKAAKDLSRHIAPFILRRLKQDVLTELPEKLERRMLNEMTEAQSKIYDAYFVNAKKELVAELRKNGFEKSRIKILALLTRLRQIACDPALFLEDYTGGSGKLDMLEEIVEEAVGVGHRILIFSQFTTMLHNISSRLEQMNVKHYYLDGGTPAKERIRLVKSFNENTENTSVFLLSLKAGGTGLNLTGADVVINYDPWWNPAVEDQAADRAYRIGQQKNVQVIKLITKGTIEEQIYELQEMKKALIDKMLQPGENFLNKLSEDELIRLFER